MAKGWRGGERQTLYTAKGLLQKGIQAAILCRKDDTLEERSRETGIAYHSVKGRRALFRFLCRHAHTYDILHCQGSSELTYAILAKPFHRRPVVVTKRVDVKPKGFFTRLKYLASDAVVAISQSIRNNLLSFGIKEVDIIYSMVLPVQQDQERAADLLGKTGVNGRKVVATTTAFDRWKDPFTMLNAIKILSTQRTDFVFLHFGGGNLEKEIVAKINELELSGFYVLAGNQKNVEALFHSFDVFVLNSKREGLGSSVLDAFYYKVPVAASDTGGLSELLAEERGILYEVGNAEGLANAISQLLIPSASGGRYTENAYMYVIREHTLDTCIEKYIELYHSLVK